ncbi:MAG: hypothetical protein K2O41_05595 [Clostridia bacterium]|nr:hypothetical protein [Clostridia bacterium]
MYDLKQIAGTLKYGQFDGSKRKYIIAAFIAITVICLTLLIAALAVFIVDYINSAEKEPVTLAAELIGMSIAFCVLPILSLFLFLHNEKSRKKIILWLQDAVELKAFCETLLTNYYCAVDELFAKPASVKIRVRFKYKDKRYSRDSGYKDKNGYYKNDYQRVWVRYADKYIRILYSPKYDEVIVLKKPVDN